MTPKELLDSDKYLELEWKDIFYRWEKWCVHLCIVSVSFEKKYSPLWVYEQPQVVCNVKYWFKWLSHWHHFWLLSDQKTKDGRTTLINLGWFMWTPKEAFEYYIKPKITSMENDIELYNNYFDNVNTGLDN
jgi:hypothetical protein